MIKYRIKKARFNTTTPCVEISFTINNDIYGFYLREDYKALIHHCMFKRANEDYPRQIGKNRDNLSINNSYEVGLDD